MPRPYGSYFSQDDAPSGVSRLMALVGDALQVGQEVEGFVQRRKGRKLAGEERERQANRQRDTDARAGEDQRRQTAEFRTRQDEAGYEEVSGDDPITRTVNRNLGEGVGGMLTGMAAKRPSSWVKTKKSKQEEAAAARAEGASASYAEREADRREAARESADLRRELQAEQIKSAEARAERARAESNAPTREEREQGRAESALHFAETRRDRVVKGRPDESKFTDMNDVLDVPKFNAARKSYVSDSTAVERDVRGASNRVARSMGLPEEQEQAPYDDKATTAAAQNAIAKIRASNLSDDEKKARIATVNERLRKARGGE